jgi:hypothetical protein
MNRLIRQRTMSDERALVDLDERFLDDPGPVSVFNSDNGEVVCAARTGLVWLRRI